ncbi:helix-turn-helix domain-containing protein [Enterococcus faecalis]
MSIVDRIKMLASQKKMTLTELERKLDFSQSSIRKWDKQPPGIKNYKKLQIF